jgi:hypothetical protein
LRGNISRPLFALFLLYLGGKHYQHAQSFLKLRRRPNLFFSVFKFASGAAPLPQPRTPSGAVAGRQSKKELGGFVKTFHQESKFSFR